MLKCNPVLKEQLKEGQRGGVIQTTPVYGLSPGMSAVPSLWGKALSVSSVSFALPSQGRKCQFTIRPS